MIGGPFTVEGKALVAKLDAQLHKEYAKAMAKQRPDDTIVLGRKPYPTYYTTEEGGTWYELSAFISIRFSDGSIYDTKTKSWRLDRVDPIAQWERNKAAYSPLASSGMIQAGEHLVREVKQLRGRILDLETERREHAGSLPMFEDEERDF